MHLVVLGLNHNTAPLDVREKFHVSEDDLSLVLSDLITKGATEAVLLSTCNRTEIYVTGHSREDAVRLLEHAFLSRFDEDRSWLQDHTYLFNDGEAFKHLFLVASGLDSMVVGEPQILGQVKDAYRAASDAGVSGSFCEKVFKRAFHVAKRVRTETKIGYDPVSISSMAVELARKIFGEFQNRQVLVIGAGEMCEVALKHFKKDGIRNITITNRTLSRAQQLAEDVIGTAHPFDELSDLLLKADMVLSSTGADQPIIDKATVATAMRRRKNRPLFFIDIAVPRDVEPEVNNLENVYLYDIDDLKGLAQAHLTNRLQESQKAHAIVDEEVTKFQHWLRSLDRNPLITEILDSVESMRSRELKKTLQKMKNVDQDTMAQLDGLTRNIVNKLIHPYLVMVKKNGSPAVLDSMRSLLVNREENEKDMDSGDKGE
jgi:glutamyl-tRNA reductase